eukprot:1544399-Amphidinium_carterae.1
MPRCYARGEEEQRKGLWQLAQFCLPPRPREGSSIVVNLALGRDYGVRTSSAVLRLFGASVQLLGECMKYWLNCGLELEAAHTAACKKYELEMQLQMLRGFRIWGYLCNSLLNI